MLKYRDLTDFEKKHICNGCGSKSGFVKVPSFRFEASCNQHDFYYWRGGNDENRLRADIAFYFSMLEDIKKASWYSKPFYHSWAYIYFQAVRVFGKEFFNYREVPKNRAVLRKEIKRKRNK